MPVETPADTPANPFVFAPEKHSRRLNLGCGFDIREGYLNVDFQDFHSPDLVADVRELPMLPSNTFDEIVAQDVLEHLPRSDTAKSLTEWGRLLRPGGTLTLQMPDVTACGRIISELNDPAEHAKWLGMLFGTQGYTGDFHLAGFTDLVLIQVLTDAGFDRVELGTRDGWMLTSHCTKSDPGRAAEPSDALAVGWLYGCWGLESSESGSWRWCSTDAHILLANTADHPVTAEVSFGIGRSPGTAADVTVAVSGHTTASVDTVAAPAAGEAAWARMLTLAPGATRIRVSTDAAPLDVPDSRTLGLRLTNPSILVRPST